VFSLHFSFDVDLENAIIYEKIHGIWQAKTAHEYHLAFMDEVAPLTGKPWAKLVNLSNWKTSYPEVADIIGGEARRAAYQILELDGLVCGERHGPLA